VAVVGEEEDRGVEEARRRLLYFVVWLDVDEEGARLLDGEGEAA
jgi:hypothetical protein